MLKVQGRDGTEKDLSAIRECCLARKKKGYSAYAAVRGGVIDVVNDCPSEDEAQAGAAGSDMGSRADACIGIDRGRSAGLEMSVVTQFETL